MTIALSIKINDGIVLAADSASTTTTQFQDGTQIVRVYNNANKVLNLHKQIPVGIITWGNGAIGMSSIATIVKDFRKIITSSNDKIDPNNYSLKDLSGRFYHFIFDKYVNEYSGLPEDQQPYTGFTISGFSSGEDLAEEWRINLQGMNNSGVLMLSKKEDSHINWSGQPEAIHRLVNGYTMSLVNILVGAGYEKAEAEKIASIVGKKAGSPFIHNYMPIKDAIDIAEFLVDMTAKFGKYTSGDRSVGGPIEIAAITKHEGFKWVKRKLYFTEEYNFRREQND